MNRSRKGYRGQTILIILSLLIVISMSCGTLLSILEGSRGPRPRPTPTHVLATPSPSAQPTQPPTPAPAPTPGARPSPVPQ